MKKDFIKYFDITYKGKKFTIFVDDFHRYTFLEKDKEGNYLYPFFNIKNNKGGFLCILKISKLMALNHLLIK